MLILNERRGVRPEEASPSRSSAEGASARGLREQLLQRGHGAAQPAVLIMDCGWYVLALAASRALIMRGPARCVGREGQ